MNGLDIITTFTSPEFGQVRTTTIDGEPWFVGRDLARALGYGDDGKSATNAVSRHVDPEDRSVTEIVTEAGRRNITIINESGLYSLILSSKLPSAKRFKHWVTAEVLPAIFKTGGYMTPAAKQELAVMLNGMVASAVCEVIDQALSPVNEELSAVRAAQAKAEHYIVKIGKNQNYTNYFLLREFGSTTKSGWKNTVSARLKVIEDATTISQFDQLNAVYTYMKNRFDVDWDRYRKLYSKVNGVAKPSTLDVVCDSDVLMSKFDEAMDDLFGRLELPVPEVPAPEVQDDPFGALVARAAEHRGAALA